ncbi:subtype B tannase [Lactiplantibacillus paraplantarum]|uniref:subtype B tannase n=1 Tax=Lactiplantibacillus paraplantarum TaxID=60520 RepID=UPI000E08F41A|nr:subtype B tannase [Lactiplantibacillus paraplantarum]RDG11327.1 tannase [Lactiplantibacillus paraplantarum]
MSNRLIFDADWLVPEQVQVAGQAIQYYAARNIQYVQHPVAAIQVLNVFVPAAYLHGSSVNGYQRATAPILMPNTVGGYLPGPADDPQRVTWPTNAGTIQQALKRGYVVVAAGIRGRTTVDKSGQRVGQAPAFIVDMMAAIRYVKYNQGRLPGDANRIITNGTSAGGATSALAGASGNSAYFEPALTALGAAPATDDIFAVSAYCPIHNLEHADMAYEWQFNGINDWHRYQPVAGTAVNGRPKFEPVSGVLDSEAQALSATLKRQFRDYLNHLGLKATDGTTLTVTAAGTGPFREVVRHLLMASAQTALDQGTDIHKYAGFTVTDGQVTELDLTAYLKSLTRMKAVPAFDQLDLDSPENNLFGDALVLGKHFTALSQARSTVTAQLADDDLVKAVNPISYLLTQQAQVAKHWRIRHGAADRDTSFAIPIILATMLKNQGYDVDFALPWDIPHSGDYDLGELFAWIDHLCQ